MQGIESQTTSSIVELDERQWLTRHCRGDQHAFAELLGAYQGSVYGYIARCGVSAASRDDLFQEVFLKIHKTAARYQPARALRPWIFTIVANTVRNHFRDESTRRAHLGEFDVAQASDPRGTERQVSATQTLEQVEHAISALPLAQREVLLLVSVEGLLQREVSAVLGMPLNTVKTHLRRARMALAQSLQVSSEGDIA